MPLLNYMDLFGKREGLLRQKPFFEQVKTRPLDWIQTLSSFLIDDGKKLNKMDN
jgi:hypothetical protein